MSSQYNDADDDLPLHTRASHTESYQREVDANAPDREVTLNTGVVLGIFFALALLCAVFFGFGYSIGHKSAPAAMAPGAAEPDVATVVSDSATPTTAAKPSAVPQVVPQYVPSPGRGVELKPSAAAAPESKPAVKVAAVAPPAPTRPAPAVRVETTPAPAPLPATGTGTIYVQVAAVSHQEDADVLQNALRRRGYAVHVRTDASDHLMHIQVGPLSTRKDAEAMRQRLAGDGYNGFIK